MFPKNLAAKVISPEILRMGSEDEGYENNPDDGWVYHKQQRIRPYQTTLHFSTSKMGSSYYSDNLHYWRAKIKEFAKVEASRWRALQKLKAFKEKHAQWFAGVLEQLPIRMFFIGAGTWPRLTVMRLEKSIYSPPISFNVRSMEEEEAQPSRGEFNQELGESIAGYINRYYQLEARFKVFDALLDLAIKNKFGHCFNKCVHLTINGRNYILQKNTNYWGFVVVPHEDIIAETF